MQGFDQVLRELLGIAERMEIAEDAKQPPEKKATGPQQWTQAEHELFLEGVERYGRSRHTQIAQLIGTKKPSQVISHSQKYFIKLQKLCREAHKYFSGSDLAFAPASLRHVQSYIVKKYGIGLVVAGIERGEYLAIFLATGQRIQLQASQLHLQHAREKYMAVLKESGRSEFALVFLKEELEVERGELALML